MTFTWLRHPFSHAAARTLCRSAIRIIWVLVAGLGFALTYFLLHGPDGPQHWSSDFVITHFSPAPRHQNADIVLIFVTNKTLRDLPYTSPIDRQLLAALVNTVGNAGARAVGLDFVFDRKSEECKDKILIKAIHDAPVPVVIGALDERSPSAAFDAQYQKVFLERAQRKAGHLYFDDRRNPLVNTDHVVRSIAPSVVTDSMPISFAEVLAAAGGSPLTLRSPQISWLPSPQDGSETFLTLSAEDVLGTGDLNVALPLKQLLSNKYVIIGGNFSDRDQHLTPLSISGAQYPGAWIHAQGLAQILSKRALYQLTTVQEFIVTLLIFVFGVFIGRHEIDEHHHPAIELSFAAGLVLLAVFCFRYFDFLFPFSFAFFGGMIGVVTGHYYRRRARTHRSAKRRQMSVTRFVPLLVAASLAFLMQAARAEMLVLESTDSHYRPGDRVPSDTLKIEEPSARVKVLMLETNTTKVFESADRAIGSVPFGAVRSLRHEPQ